MQPHRAVHRSNERHFDVEDVHENFFALAIDLVVALRSKEVEALRADSLHEGLAAAGQNHHAIVGVGTDAVKEIDELFMGVPIKDERAAISVQRHFQHTTFRACQAGVVEAVAISV